MAYLPMAWIGDHMFSFGQSMVAGFTTNCPESAATVLADLKEIGPTYFFAPPRIWENILTSVMIRVDDTAWVKRRMVHFFLGLARRVERRRLAHRAPALARPAALPARLAARLRAAARQPGHGPDPRGLHRGRGDRPRALRVLPLARRQREAALRHDRIERADLHPAGRRRQARHGGPAAARRRGAHQRDRRGAVPEPGRVPGLLPRIRRPPGETLDDGWVHSGDAGFFDQDGHLKIIDRARDVGRLSGARSSRPSTSRTSSSSRRTSRRRSAWATRAASSSALINIDLASVGNWAERRGLAYTSYTDLAQKPEVYELIRQEVVRVNRSLLDEEALRGRPDPALPAPAQGAGRGRPGDHPHPQGAAGLRGREVRAADRGALRRRRPRQRGGAGDLRGRAHRHRAGGGADQRRRDLLERGARERRDEGAGRPAAHAAPRGQRDQRALRGGAGARAGEPRDPARRDRGHHRPQRRGQDHAAQRRQRLLPPVRGPDPLRGPRPHAASGPTTWPRSGWRAPSRTWRSSRA